MKWTLFNCTPDVHHFQSQIAIVRINRISESNQIKRNQRQSNPAHSIQNNIFLSKIHPIIQKRFILPSEMLWINTDDYIPQRTTAALHIPGIISSSSIAQILSHLLNYSSHHHQDLSRDVTACITQRTIHTLSSSTTPHQQQQQQQLSSNAFPKRPYILHYERGRLN